MPIPENEKTVWQMQGHTVTEMLWELLNLKRAIVAQDEDIRLPLISLHLRTGSAITGYLMDIKEKSSEGTFALVWVLSEATGGRYQLCFLDTSHIAAVIIHDAVQFQDAQKTLARGQPMSALQWNRQVTELAANVASVLGKPTEIELVAGSFEDSNEIRGLLFKVLRLAAAQLPILTSDKFGKETVAKAIGKVVVKKDVPDGMALMQGGLFIDPTQLEAASPEEIRARLNRLF
jgi:hypothetical protein